ncbi:hypothetical protein ISR92_02380 [Patescibacteria group bacterium]|nr:hypothetical protein [Patescibacteria group bacterium]
MNILKIVLFIILIGLGILMFIYAEIDDSPGGQLIGVMVSAIGVIGIIKGWKATK